MKCVPVNQPRAYKTPNNRQCQHVCQGVCHRCLAPLSRYGANDPRNVWNRVTTKCCLCPEHRQNCHRVS